MEQYQRDTVFPWFVNRELGQETSYYPITPILFLWVYIIQQLLGVPVNKGRSEISTAYGTYLEPSTVVLPFIDTTVLDFSRKIDT